METLFTGRTEFDQAFRDLLARNPREIALFDHDLSCLPLESPEVHAQLSHCLTQSQDCKLRIALHDATHFEKAMPRMRHLHERLSHLIQIRLTPEHLRHIADTLLISPDALVTRFHRDHDRGKAIFDDVTAIQPYQNRFDALWQEAADEIPAHPLGL